jgi:hypothetical protein
MTQQPSLFPQQAPAPNPEPLPNRRRRQSSRQTPSWLLYLELSVRVVVRLYLGLVILVLPWTHFWSDNRLFLLVPHLSSIAVSGITRGVISGLGLLNLWIALSDAIHHKERAG